ncbi:uncharacterized protein [Pyrus communis]|uniref:uncharacterized protein n=1 Tax=Pyrus communis TaxID=23211 RepID=UPI0035C07423
MPRKQDGLRRRRFCPLYPSLRRESSTLPGFLARLESPGRTWMLIFTAEKELRGGRYFPITAVQRFDAAGKRIENGVYFGPFGCLTFEGRLAWKERILAFVFEARETTQSLARRIHSLYGFTLMKN